MAKRIHILELSDLEAKTLHNALLKFLSAAEDYIDEPEWDNSLFNSDGGDTRRSVRAMGNAVSIVERAIRAQTKPKAVK